jgi:hypothetical protein
MKGKIVEARMVSDGKLVKTFIMITFVLGPTAWLDVYGSVLGLVVDIGGYYLFKKLISNQKKQSN